MKLTVGVMGSAYGSFDESVLARLLLLGRTIAERDCVLMTGAYPGLPYAAVQGARAAGGLVVGISPGLSRDEHEHKYASPVDEFDVLVYAGSGLMGRKVENIRSSDAEAARIARDGQSDMRMDGQAPCRVRIVAFGGHDGTQSSHVRTIGLGRCAETMVARVRAHRDVLAGAQFKDPVLGLFALNDKVMR